MVDFSLAVHFLLLKIASLVGIGLVLKRSGARGLDKLAVIRVSCAVAAVLAFFGAVLAGNPHISWPTALLAAVIGVLFVAGFIFWFKAIESAGLGASLLAIGIAIAVPVLASIVIWHEAPKPIEIIGAGIALAALGLVISEVAYGVQTPPTLRNNPRVRLTEERKASTFSKSAGGGLAQSASVALQTHTNLPRWLWLVGLFLVSGLVNTGAKVFHEEMPQAEIMPFLAVLFVSAFIVTTLLYYLGKSRISRPALYYGVAFGVASLGSLLFLILALTMLGGTVVYPVAAGGEAGLMALAGILIRREKLGFRGWLGIGLAVVSLVLVQFGRAGTG